MSSPPPSTPPPEERARPVRRTREIELRLAGAATGWRRRIGPGPSGGSGGFIRLSGTEIIFAQRDALLMPLTIPAGLVAVASVDRGRAKAGEGEGRFAILHRMSASAVIPVEEGVEGWLWTARSGSALPMLGDGAPNLALVFVKPLEAEVVDASFRPEFLAALAERSPLGAPTVFGLLARVESPTDAEGAFAELGVDRLVTDREVAPAQRRHLPGDRPANPSIVFPRDSATGTSVPPPGTG